MKKTEIKRAYVLFIVLVVGIAQVYAQTMPSCIESKNEQGLGKTRSTHSEYDQAKEKCVDFIFLEELSDCDGENEVTENLQCGQDIDVADDFDKENCTFNGIPLHGKVKVVENFGDIKVQIVTSFPDLKVKIVENFPDKCGEWQFVENFPDFTIQMVTSFPDLKIQYVNSFPGTR